MNQSTVITGRAVSEYGSSCGSHTAAGNMLDTQRAGVLRGELEGKLKLWVEVGVRVQ